MGKLPSLKGEQKNRLHMWWSKKGTTNTKNSNHTLNLPGAAKVVADFRVDYYCCTFFLFPAETMRNLIYSITQLKKKSILFLPHKWVKKNKIKLRLQYMMGLTCTIHLDCYDAFTAFNKNISCWCTTTGRKLHSR